MFSLFFGTNIEPVLKHSWIFLCSLKCRVSEREPVGVRWQLNAPEPNWTSPFENGIDISMLLRPHVSATLLVALMYLTLNQTDGDGKRAAILKISGTVFVVWLEGFLYISAENKPLIVQQKNRPLFSVNHSCTIQLGRAGYNGGAGIWDGLLPLICLVRASVWLKSGGGQRPRLSQTSARKMWAL